MAIKINSVNRESKKTKIALFGFDHANFKIPTARVVSKEEVDFHLVPYEASQVQLDFFDGVILPSGIFEHIEYKGTYVGGYGMTCSYDEKNLLIRERQLNNHLKAGKWVAFLAGSIVDVITDKNFNQIDISQTDLCKRFLNSLEVKRKTVQNGPLISHKRNEFETYVKRFGSCQTYFSFGENNDCHMIAGNKDVISGFCDDQQRIFFLPFLNNDYTEKNLVYIGSTITSSIEAFRNNLLNSVPDWLNDFRFNKEESLLLKKQKLLDELRKFDKQLNEFTDMKTILTSTGGFLVSGVEKFLKDFLGIGVRNIEKFEEDLGIIINDQLKGIMEVKGVKGNIARSHITKTEEHRDANGLSHDFPAILVINDNMELKGFDQRRVINIPGDIIKYATVQNIKVLRTITLLDFASSCEALSSELRNKLFVDFFMDGRGGLVTLEKGQLFLKQG